MKSIKFQRDGTLISFSKIKDGEIEIWIRSLSHYASLGLWLTPRQVSKLKRFIKTGPKPDAK